jgi:hypothetical protein
MTTKAGFNAEDWSVVTNAPFLTALLVIAADRGGTVRESIAISRAYADARKQGGGELLARCCPRRRRSIPRPLRARPRTFIARCAATLRQAVGILERHAAEDEVVAYKRYSTYPSYYLGTEPAAGSAAGVGCAAPVRQDGRPDRRHAVPGRQVCEPTGAGASASSSPSRPQASLSSSTTCAPPAAAGPTPSRWCLARLRWRWSTRTGSGRSTRRTPTCRPARKRRFHDEDSRRRSAVTASRSPARRLRLSITPMDRSSASPTGTSRIATRSPAEGIATTDGFRSGSSPADLPARSPPTNREPGEEARRRRHRPRRARCTLRAPEDVVRAQVAVDGSGMLPLLAAIDGSSVAPTRRQASLVGDAAADSRAAHVNSQ